MLSHQLFPHGMWEPAIETVWEEKKNPIQRRESYRDTQHCSPKAERRSYSSVVLHPPAAQLVVYRLVINKEDQETNLALPACAPNDRTNFTSFPLLKADKIVQFQLQLRGFPQI